MNRLVTLLALAIVVSGPASANIINPYGNPELNTNVVAGQVSGTGVIERGLGFRVHRTHVGVYEITFDRRYFPSGCAAMVVSPNIALTPVVTQINCGDTFDVSFSVNTSCRVRIFFIAREDAPT